MEDIQFEVYKYEVYYSYYDESRVIIPEDRWGFIIDDLPYGRGIVDVSQLYPDHYIFTRNEEYDSLDVYILCDTNKDTISQYMSEYDISCTLYSGTVVSWNSRIFPIQSRIVLPDINMIEKDVRDIVRQYLDSNDDLLDLFPIGYIDTMDMSINNRVCTSDDVPRRDMLFPVYFCYAYQSPWKIYVHANDHRYGDRDIAYKQYTRHILDRFSSKEYNMVCTLFVSRVGDLSDIDIICV